MRLIRTEVFGKAISKTRLLITHCGKTIVFKNKITCAHCCRVLESYLIIKNYTHTYMNIHTHTHSPLCNRVHCRKASKNCSSHQFKSIKHISIK